MSERAKGSSTLYPHAMTVDEISDRIALQHLVMTYGHAIDRRDYSLLKSLYHDDAIDDHSPYFIGSASDYVDWLPSMLANWSATSHTMFNMVFALDGDRAEGVISARAWHRTTDGSREFTAWGRYADRYRRQDGIWRFAHRFFILDASEEGASTTSESFSTDGVELGAAGREDPIYRRLPLFAAARKSQED